MEAGGWISHLQEKWNLERVEMNQTWVPNKKILLAGLLGAIGGGLFAVLITRAIPKMMSGMMTKMMKNWMASMKDETGNPVDT